MPKPDAMRRFLVLPALVAVLFATPSAYAYHLEGARWASATIRYHTEIPAYTWSVDTAAYAWNSSGAGVRFVKAPRSRAKVLVGIRWFKTHAGEARMQRIGGTIVNAQIAIQSGHDRYEMALIVAHELGHVLGLDHETTRCATMNPSVGDDHTTLCPLPPSGLWTCRLLQPDDVRGAVSLYGGIVRAWHGSPFCQR